MSPEQLRGAAVDHRTDIWAFGCLLHELLTGQPVFHGETTPAAPERVRNLLRRCLQSNPAKRPSSMTEVREAIDEVLAGRRGMSRRGLAAALGVSVVVAAALSLALSNGLRERVFGRGAQRIRTIAVLPLANLSGNSDQEYFSDGMTESLINELAKVGALNVISRTSVMTYKGSKKPLREIAKALGADAVLEGAAQRAGDRIRISAQLMDGKTDQQLWANSYDRNFADVLTLQREVAETVAQQIGAKLTTQEQARLAPTPAVNTRAHDAYLQGLFYLNRASPADYDRAQRYFELALMNDPRYALADAALARLWAARQQYGLASPQEAGPQATAHAERAIALDPNLPEAHLALAITKGWTLWDWSGAEGEFVSALRLNPSYADARALYSHLLIILGRPDEARAQIERAVDLDPNDAFVWGIYGVDLSWFGRYDDALAAVKRKNDLNPNLLFGSQVLWSARLAKGQYEQAVQAFIAFQEKVGDDAVAAAARSGEAGGGYRTAFLEAAKAAEAKVAAANGEDSALDVAWMYVYAGRMDLALPWYQRAVDARDPNIPYIRLSMLPEKIPETDPAFRAILKRVGIP